MSNDISRIFDILQHSAALHPDITALSSKKRGVWKSYTYKEYQQIVDQLTLGFIALGVVKGDTIASITNNRPEWNFIDMAIAQAGAVHVPLYPNYNLSDFKYILNNAGAKYIFTGNKLLWDILSKIRTDLPFVQEVFCFDEHPGLHGLNYIIEKGADLPENILNERKSTVQGDDLVSLYYTSGTTGYPKGAMVTHKSLSLIVSTMYVIYHIQAGQKVLSYLPLCHSYESAHNYMFQYTAASVYYAESTSTVIDNMLDVQPEMFLTVPLLLEKIVGSITESGRISTGFRKKLFHWSYDLAMKYDTEHPLTLAYKLKLAFARMFVFGKWKKMMGGKVKMISAGGASAPEHFLKLFAAMGITIQEVYGLTETYCIAVNSLLYGIRFGTGGVVFTNVEVMLSDEGEILAKSPYITRGYYKQPELTAKIIDEAGWFHTGDIGEFVDGKFLKIIGRKSVTFKTSSGNFVVPENIEKQLKQNPFFAHVMIVGKDKSFLSALIVPHFEYIAKWCNLAGITNCEPGNLVKNDKVLAEFQKEIDKHNKTSWETELIRKFRLLPDDWSVAGGELTPLMKIKRNVVEQKYKSVIEGFYEEVN